MTPRMVIGGVATLLAGALGFLLSGVLLSGVTVDGFWAALLAFVVVGVIDAVAWPSILRITLPLTVLTLGLGVLLLNGAVVMVVAWILPGVEIARLLDGVLVTLICTALTILVAAILSIDQEERVVRHLVRRAARTEGGVIRTDVPGVLFLEIDGLAYDVLRRAMRDGNAPALARWSADGSHRLLEWETDWSSQTGACQAGLLHGNNDDMPAFRWWEKDAGRAIVTNHPRDAAEIERRVSDGRGLLHADGASRANILSGDAPHSLLTMSTVLAVRRPGQRVGHDYYTYFAAPYNLARTMILSVVDIARELRAASEQRRHDVRPRVHRGIKYALLRAWATVVQLDLQMEAVLGDLYAGRPVVYTTFLAYDEVAHHSGIERPDTLAVLRSVDRAIARIAEAAEHAPRPYELVVLSDHGQSQGATFLQRYGESLEGLVQRVCRTDDVQAMSAEEDEALGRVGAALTEAARAPGAGGHMVRTATRGRSVDGQVMLGPGEDEPEPESLPEIVVMASGCLGLISFPRLPGRVTREEIDERYPQLLAALREHPGIGFVLVRSGEEGAVALGSHGEHRLHDGRVDGEDPLAPYGPRTAQHVARTDGFAHCPDVLVNSTYWPDMDEVAAFEELVGSHGGLGGPQAHPFVLAPARLRMPEEELVGAEHLHRVMRGWL
ncbi:MAG TPA: phage holin family protein, partial [Solirubrobacteraceae bacterium]|nr:phage holin family protein [Solirubrobacteraceae bacterium]